MSHHRVSANLGFLWNDLPLPTRFEKAASAGFKLVECHAIDLTPQETAKICKDTKLQLLQLNAGTGDTTKGEFGLGVVNGAEHRFKHSIEHAIEVCIATGAKNIHAIAGDGNTIEHLALMVKNLRVIAPMTQKHGLTVILEPLNPYDKPFYLYSKLAQVSAVIAMVGAANVKIMADIYHIARTEGDVMNKLTLYKSQIGHVQVASVPARREIDEGELNYKAIFPHLHTIGLNSPIGLEYKPRANVETGLGFMAEYGLRF